jgi:hypothetical protein
MRVALRDRLTFSNVISMVALFVALGGVGAYAADKLGSKDIAKNAIKSKHIKADAATGDDINEGSLGTVPRANRASSTEFADTAGDAETLEGFFPDEFQFGNGFDTAAAGGIDNGGEGAYFAFGGDVVISCDETTPTVRWDDLDGDDFVTDVWINGVHEAVADGASSAETNLGTDDTATIHAWDGSDVVSLIHASVSYSGDDDVCVVAFTAQENFNAAGGAAAASPGAAKGARARAGTARGLSNR